MGSGIETLLRLEGRYELKRATKLGEAAHIAKAWPADAALVDATMLTREGRVALGVPALVLAAGEAENAGAARLLDDARGWLAKDAASAELVAGVERLLTRGAAPTAGALPLVVLGALSLLFAMLLLYLVWIAVV